MLHQPLADLVGQAVFLQATVGLVGNGHLNQAFGQGGFDVAFVKGLRSESPQGGLQRLAAALAPDGRQQRADLGGNLRADLGGAEVVVVSRIIRNMKVMNGAESVLWVLS